MEIMKEILKSFTQGYVSGLVLNGGVMALSYFIFWKLLKKRIQKYRIQLKEKVNPQQIKRELKNALFSLAVGALFSSMVIWLSSLGYTKIYTSFTDYHPVVPVIVFFVIWFIDDAWFYWCHRLLHHPRIYRYIHAEHHKSIDVNPFTSMSFHFMEPFLLSFWIFPVSMLIPTYAPVLMLVQIIGLLENIKSHLGYEFYPSWLNKSWLRFFTSSTYHNMHHTKFKGNYGVHFRLWDKWMDTELKDYETEYEHIKKRK
jgi:sterol desaturase/sphingolipid hydroxylase (fatty acid hydroxylase superfamily)